MTNTKPFNGVSRAHGTFFFNRHHVVQSVTVYKAGWGGVSLQGPRIKSSVGICEVLTKMGKCSAAAFKYLLFTLNCVRFIKLYFKKYYPNQTSKSINVGETQHKGFPERVTLPFILYFNSTYWWFNLQISKEVYAQILRTLPFQPLFNFGMFLRTWHNILLANKCLAFFSLD